MYIKCFSFLAVALYSQYLSAQECNRADNATTPTQVFTVNTDGTVIDKRSGLMWMRCPMGMRWNSVTCADVADKFNWLRAKTEIQFMNTSGGYAGYKDWRLPKLSELQQLVERQCANPAINAKIFPQTPITGYWTNTEHAHYAQGAWLVYFQHGSSYMGNIQQEWAVRPVRSTSAD